MEGVQAEDERGGRIGYLLRPPTDFVLSYVRSRKEAVILLRLGQAAEELDFLVQGIAQFLEGFTALADCSVRMRTMSLSVTTCLPPILAKVEEKFRASADTLTELLADNKKTLLFCLESLMGFAEQNVHFCRELEVEQVTSLAKKKKSLAWVEFHLCDRLRALLRGDDEALRHIHTSATELCKVAMTSSKEVVDWDLSSLPLSAVNVSLRGATSDEVAAAQAEVSAPSTSSQPCSLTDPQQEQTHPPGSHPTEAVAQPSSASSSQFSVLGTAAVFAVVNNDLDVKS